MINLTQFRIIGRIGSITTLDKVTHISIASDRRTKNEKDEWITETSWNSVAIFSDKMRTRFNSPSVNRHGNQIIVEGTIQSNSIEKDGHKVYQTTLAAQDIEILSFAKDADT
jgi:single-strand DNA-binding protein